MRTISNKKNLVLVPLVVLGAVFGGGMPASANSVQELDRGLGIVTLYEGNSARGDVVHRTSDRPGQWFRPWENDEARSMVLEHVRAGAVITVYDDSDGGRHDDYAQITVRKSMDYLVIDTFEADASNEYVEVDYKPRDNLDGKVSRVQID